jgi:cell wall-associated NlpC family hydrolase
MTKRQKFATYILACSMLFGGVAANDSAVASAAPVPSQAVAATADEIATSAAAALASMGTEQFPMRLGDASSAAAARLEVDPDFLYTAWASADRPHQIALLSALTQVGVPYRRNTSKVGVAFDCSGLTAYAWSQAGIEMAHQSRTQLRASALRTYDTAQAGDLVYYPGHVMLWLGLDNLIVHAPYRGHPVEVDQLSTRRIKRVKFADPTG